MKVPSVVCCPNPSCPGRSVHEEDVLRETWEATWWEGRQPGPYPVPGEWDSDIACPACGTEGIDPESGQLDSAEEELGTRCPHCGVVSYGGTVTAKKPPPIRDCPHCNEPMDEGRKEVMRPDATLKEQAREALDEEIYRALEAGLTALEIRYSVDLCIEVRGENPEDPA